MRNDYAKLESGWIPGNLYAFRPNAVGKIQLYAPVVDAVEWVADTVGDVVETVGDVAQDVLDVAVDVVEDVGETVGNVVEHALDNPVATIATIAAIAAGQPHLIPYINGANTLAQGGDFDDALKSAAISYVAQGVGNYVGGQLGTAAQYGTDIGSQQTAMLAAQSGDMLGGTFGGTVGGAAGAAAAGATAAALSGGDIDQALINALGNYAVRTGVNYGVNAAGKMVDQFGNEAPPEVQNQIMSEASDISYELDNIGNVSPENILSGVDYGETYGDVLSGTKPGVDPYEVDNVGNVSQENILSGQTEAPVVDPYEVDNVGNVSQENILSGQTDVPVVDPYEVDNVGNRTEGQILTGQTPQMDLAGAAGKYLKNQFTNALTRQITGDLMPDRPRPTGAPLQRRPFGLAGTPGVSESLTNLGFSNIPAPEFTIPDAAEEGPFTPVSMWDPGISEDWETDQKLGGLGFAGKFINEEQPEVEIDEDIEPVSSVTTEDVEEPDLSNMSEREVVELWDPGVSSDWGPQDKLGGLGFSGSFINQDDDYINAQADERQRIIDEVRQRGWMTEEERATLEQGSGFFDIDDENLLADASPWYSTEYAKGGHIDHRPEFYSEGGASLANRYVKGNGDGTSDSVPAMLASGEFVIPADVVSGLGNGDNDAGAKVLDEFMAAIRHHKRSTNPRELPPDSEGPLAYLAKATKKVGKNGRA